MSIKDDLNADSISVMEFVLELEDEFGTEISDEDAGADRNSRWSGWLYFKPSCLRQTCKS